MELEDCAFPLLAGMVGTADPKVAFKDADVALLVGAGRAARAWSARTCCWRTRKIFIEQGKALDAVGVAQRQGAGRRQPGQHQRLHRDEVGAVAAEEELHRDAAARPQPRAVAARGEDRQAGRRDREADRLGQPLADACTPTTASPTVGGQSVKDADQRRGLEPQRVPAHGAASAARRSSRRAACRRRRRAANAAIDHVRDWVLGSNGKWVTMGIAVRRQLRHSAGRDVRRPGHHGRTASTRASRACDRRLLARADGRDAEGARGRARRRGVAARLSRTLAIASRDDQLVRRRAIPRRGRRRDVRCR